MRRFGRKMDRLPEWRCKPSAIRVHNGPEYLSKVFTDWCEEKKVYLN
jgi:hypothetical protein